MSAEWEDRCRDCDDTGITIQTERLCACQPLSKEPPMTEMPGVLTIRLTITKAQARKLTRVTRWEDRSAKALEGERGTITAHQPRNHP
ncbi:hypothetical protein SAMN06272759_1252 [Novosphingobium sp. B1]|nr:hypothetical protein SAMN06272759_1252 [Novosphingobium sp. B1]